MLSTTVIAMSGWLVFGVIAVAGLGLRSMFKGGSGRGGEGGGGWSDFFGGDGGSDGGGGCGGGGCGGG